MTDERTDLEAPYHNDHQFLSTVVQLVRKIWELTKFNLVVGEIKLLVHVIYIGPLGVLLPKQKETFLIQISLLQTIKSIGAGWKQ